MDAFWRVTELNDGCSQWIVLTLFMQKQSLFGSVISLRWQFVYGKMISILCKRLPHQEGEASLLRNDVPHDLPHWRHPT